MIQKLQAILGNRMATEQKLLNFYKIRMKALEVRLVLHSQLQYGHLFICHGVYA